MTTESEVFHVQLATGEVQVLNLDQLDDAFQKGVINENTMVFQPGETTKWIKLGELAGLGEPAPAPAPVQALAAPWPAPSPTPPPTSVGVYSVRPVALDIGGIDDDDLDFAPPFRSGGNKKWLVMGAAAVLVMTGIGIAATHGGSTPAPAAASPAKVTANIVAAAPPPAAAPAPTTDSNANRLSDDQKRALLDADKARAAQRKATAPTRSIAPRKPSAPVFHKGGKPGDPLNSAL